MREVDPTPPRDNAWPASLHTGGATGALVLALDWTNTPLGPIERWPASLRSIVTMLLHSRHPMFLWWGPELIQIYNDAYVPSFGAGKHPAAMGQPGRITWQEIWPIIWPQIEAVMLHARASWNEDHLVPIWRNGRIEEVYWTYGYSPVFDDDGAVGGTLVVCTETTSRVIAERRQKSARLLDEKIAQASDAAELLQAIGLGLVAATADIPFAMLYARDADTHEPTLTGAIGLDLERASRSVHPQLMAAISAATTGPRSVKLATFELPYAHWPEPAHEAFVVPLMRPNARSPAGWVVFGLSPRLPFDEPYRDYLARLAEDIETAQARIDAWRVRAAAIRERDNLLSHAPVATALMTGPDHVFELANDLYAEMVGRRDLLGKTYLQAFPELTDTPLPGILDEVYRNGRPFVAHDMRVPLDRGHGLEERFFRFNLEPLRDAGQVYGMMAVAVDVTEQVSARRALEKAYDERAKLLADLEAASLAKDEFLAMLGHELRNPLSPIVTALQLMRMHGDQRTAKEQQIIERQVNHLVRLVDDLLDVSKITRGKVVLKKAPGDIRDVVLNAVEIASVLLDERRHQLQLDMPKETVVWHGDAVRLTQVLTNLLTNAARYTDVGGRIRLSVTCDAEAIVLSVSDNGIGIASDMLPRVFDLFVQGKRSPDRAEGGLGLGLALVKNLVTLHGGTVEARSEGVGRGSEFLIRLPGAANASEHSVTPAAVSGRPVVKSSKRVLVVDDNADAAELLGEVLSSAGHEVTVVNDPLLALEAATQFRPEVAVLDIGLPVMDGFQLAARLRLLLAGTDCRLIALTGYGQDHDRERSREAGFDHHLVKPVDLDKLLQLVAAVHAS